MLKFSFLDFFILLICHRSKYTKIKSKLCAAGAGGSGEQRTCGDSNPHQIGYLRAPGQSETHKISYLPSIWSKRFKLFYEYLYRLSNLHGKPCRGGWMLDAGCWVLSVECRAWAVYQGTANGIYIYICICMYILQCSAHPTLDLFSFVSHFISFAALHLFLT